MYMTFEQVTVRDIEDVLTWARRYQYRTWEAVAKSARDRGAIGALKKIAKLKTDSLKDARVQSPWSGSNSL
jgi:hypothetical protein